MMLRPAAFFDSSQWVADRAPDWRSRGVSVDLPDDAHLAMGPPQRRCSSKVSRPNPATSRSIGWCTHPDDPGLATQTTEDHEHVELAHGLLLLSVMTNPNFSITFNSASRCVEFTWNNFVKDESFHEGCNAMIAALKKHSTSKLICDSRRYTVVDPADQLWSIQDWLPRAIAAGLTTFAVVMPESVVGKLSVQNVINDKKHTPKELSLTREMFNTLEDARSWVGIARKAA